MLTVAQLTGKKTRPAQVRVLRLMLLKEDAEDRAYVRWLNEVVFAP